MISDWVDDEILTVCLNFSRLAGFLAVEPTCLMSRDLDVKVDWLPLTTSLSGYSGKTPSGEAGDPMAEYKERRRHARERYASRELERDCDRLNLSVEQGSRTFDSTLAATGLLWVRKCQIDPGAYVNRVYESVYREMRDIENIDAIEQLLVSCDIPHGGFADYCESSAPAEIESLQTLLIDAGVFDSPAYLLKGERFLGRAHLPLIRWHLSRQQGPPPV